MALYKIEEFYPNYRKELFDGDDIKGLDVYAGKTSEKIGAIETVLVDDEGRFRYFVIDTGFWIFGKKVLLPVGYCQIDDRARRIYATKIRSKKQVEDLPEYHENTKINRKYEERVSKIYRSPATDISELPLEVSAPLDTPLDIPYAAQSRESERVSYNTSEHDNYNYQQEPSVYNLNTRDHQTLNLYEERLVANKKRRQTGEVVVAKHIETETARVSLPLEKERVIIERSTPTGGETIAHASNIDFREGEVTRMKVYEETAEIHKEAFVREEIKIRKEVERDTVEAEEMVRREELDIDTNARQVIDKRIGKQ